MKKRLFQHAHYLVVAALAGFMTLSCSKDPVLSGEADILTFSFAALAPPVAGAVAGNNVTATVVYNQNVTALVPTITISEKASVQPATGLAQNFTNPVAYTVTAENGTTKVYTVTVTKQAPPVLVIAPVWQKNLNSGVPPTWMTANNDRDLAAFGDFVYVHNNNDKIRVVSKTDGSDVTAGTAGFIDGKLPDATGNLFLLGTATDNQGTIVASNLRVGDAALSKWRVFKWTNKDATRTTLFEYPTPVGYRLGENLAVVGNVATNAIVYTPGGGFQTQNNKVLKFTITGGVANLTPTEITLAGVTVMGNAPDVYPVSAAANANIIVAGTGIGGIAEYTSAGVLVGKLPESLKTDAATAMLFVFALDVKPFEVNGRKVIATTATDFTTNAANAGFLYLIDYTDGWENIKASNIKRAPFTPANNINTNFNGTGGVDVVVSGNTATVYALITNFGIGAYTVTVQ
jgi:Domain of unknown function (DUF5018)